MLGVVAYERLKKIFETNSAKSGRGRLREVPTIIVISHTKVWYFGLVVSYSRWSRMLGIKTYQTPTCVISGFYVRNVHVNIFYWISIFKSITYVDCLSQLELNKYGWLRVSVLPQHKKINLVRLFVVEYDQSVELTIFRRRGDSIVAHVSTTFDNRSFSVAAPTLWNALPVSLRMIKCISTFKSNLKTYLFKLAFNIS